jgi:hypothetical protein
MGRLAVPDPEAYNLVAAMLGGKPRLRPSVGAVKGHLIWKSASQRLQFVCKLVAECLCGPPPLHERDNSCIAVGLKLAQLLGSVVAKSLNGLHLCMSVTLPS